MRMLARPLTDSRVGNSSTFVLEKIKVLKLQQIFPKHLVLQRPKMFTFQDVERLTELEILMREALIQTKSCIQEIQNIMRQLFILLNP